MTLHRNIQRFEENSSTKYSSNTTEHSYARQQGIDALKLSYSDRLTKLSVINVSDNECSDENTSPPVRKRPRQASPKLSLSTISDEEEDIGHIKVCFHFRVVCICMSPEQGCRKQYGFDCTTFLSRFLRKPIHFYILYFTSRIVKLI